MKNKKRYIGILMVILIGLLVTGCKNSADDEPTYTVWTNSITYSYYVSDIEPLLSGVQGYDGLEDNNSSRVFGNSSDRFNNISQELPDKDKHEWTESQLRELLDSWFDDDAVDRITSDFMTYTNAVIFIRTGQVVDVVLKMGNGRHALSPDLETFEAQEALINR